MTTSKYKIFYEWFLWLLTVSLLISFIVLLVYFNNTAWIGITSVLSLWFIISVFTSFYIFNSERMPNVKLCWITCVMCIPLLGCIIFYWFGVFPFKKKKMKEYANLLSKFYDSNDFLYSYDFLNDTNISSSLKKIFKYGLNIHKPITINNNIKLLKNSFEFYSATIECIKKAKKFINIQTYIIKKSNFFDIVADLLIEKAKEGVIVNFMYDWIGGLIKNPKEKILNMKKNGINVATFNTFKYNPFTGQTNYRSHRKCIIIDNEIAIYGGSNLSDDYLNLVRNNNYWKDINFKVEGEIVNSINIIFALDWENYTLRSIPIKIKKQFIENKEFYFPQYKKNIEPKICQFIESSPLIKENIIHDMLVNLIGTATERIWIITPYFYPSDDIMNQLIAASYSGIDIRIIVPGNSDDKKYILTINRNNYKKLLNAGAKLYEYYGFIHGKELIIDDQLSLVGTFNFDHRSLYSNFETGLLISNRIWNQTLTTRFEELCASSKYITYSEWITTQTFKNRLQAKIFNLLNPLF